MMDLLIFTNTRKGLTCWVWEMSAPRVKPGSSPLERGNNYIALFCFALLETLLWNITAEEFLLTAEMLHLNLWARQDECSWRWNQPGSVAGQEGLLELMKGAMLVSRGPGCNSALLQGWDFRSVSVSKISCKESSSDTQFLYSLNER